jgi:hypothetical protein
VTATLVVGTNAAGELLPSHLQVVSAAKTDDGKKLRTDEVHPAAFVIGLFGFEDETELDCTFHMNEKGGMDTEEFRKLVLVMVLRAYPDAKPVNGKWVVVLTDCGPGRENVQLCAELRLAGILLYPGLPNSTHLTQIMDWLFGLFKSQFRENLNILADRRIRENNGRDCTFMRKDIARLIYGEWDDSVASDDDSHTKSHADTNADTGTSTNAETDADTDVDSEVPNVDYRHETTLTNCMLRCFSRHRVARAWSELGYSPLTCKSLEHRDVRHEITTTDGKVDTDRDPAAAELENLQLRNHLCCDILTSFGYDGDILKRDVNRRSSEVMARNRHEKGTKERQKALAKAISAGQKYVCTGGDFLSSNDMFKAHEMQRRDAEIKNLKSKQQKAAKDATFVQELEQAREFCRTKQPRLSELKTLIKSKGVTIPAGANKPKLVEMWAQVKDNDDYILEVWTEEDEFEFERLHDTEIDLKDTALGRQKDVYMHQLVTSMNSMSLDERERIRNQLDEIDNGNH